MDVHPPSDPWSCELATVLPPWWPAPPVAEPVIGVASPLPHEEPRPFEEDPTPSMRGVDLPHLQSAGGSHA